MKNNIMVFTGFDDEHRTRFYIVAGVLQHQVRISLYKKQEFVGSVEVFLEALLARVRLFGIAVLECVAAVAHIEFHP